MRGLRLQVRPAGSRRSAAPARAAARQVPASAAKAQPSPALSASGGRVSAATSPPRGTFAWRIPSARPRSDGANQCITARPLAALTLAPSAPAATRRSTSCAKPEAIPTHPRAIAEVESPSGRTTRSPMRSVRRPHGKSVGVIPIPNAASVTPVSPRLRPNCCRNSGASTATLIAAAATVACAAVPTASTTQRYRAPVTFRRYQRDRATPGHKKRTEPVAPVSARAD